VLPADVFFSGSDEDWSPGHHLKHLVLSNKPVAYALTLPRENLRVWNAAQPRRSYSEMQTFYRGALNTGARAFGPFLPALDGTQTEAVAEYSGSIELLNHACLHWSEPELDGYAMPHPVLGLLSVREMLFFTVHHNQHHLNGVRSKLDSAGLERL
ncbi:DinB family protein, partial [Deinococcus sp.]|uniref:DinB family protein n=1 Tax=Deinococcus sp. TaxID=47478 RepID=UPI00286DEC57